MDELVPGVKIESVEDHSSEMQKLYEEIAATQAEVELNKEKRKGYILEEVERSLMRGIPVDITDEMKDLQIDMKVREIIWQFSLWWKLHKYYFDDDDFE
jgi:putative NADPH-quinone reductase